jgi:tRNA threonylcarbamoyladenosine biosynthesis protein TsaB
MNMLAIDTSNQVMGIALMQNNTIIAELTTNIKKDHSSRLMPAIVDIMEKVNMAPAQLDKIIVAKGPGSYTGTRIGITTAKTMAWALNIPIIGISSLEVLAANGALTNYYICPFFDARRQTVFTGLYQWENNRLHIVKSEQNILMEKWLDDLTALEKPILFLSPDIAAYQDIIIDKYPHAIIPEHSYHLIRPGNLLTLGTKRTPTPVHELSPNYLRITEAEANWLQEQGEQRHG